jgi:hypothetical protein
MCYQSIWPSQLELTSLHILLFFEAILTALETADVVGEQRPLVVRTSLGLSLARQALSPSAPTGLAINNRFD